MEVLQNNQTSFQLGDNVNLFDWTYIDNVVHAHLLASTALSNSLAGKGEPYETLDTPLKKIEITTGYNQIPTSLSRPRGPRKEENMSEEDKAAEKNWKEGRILVEEGDVRPVLRTKYDQFSPTSWKLVRPSVPLFLGISHLV